jgi:hypothetical protein
VTTDTLDPTQRFGVDPDTPADTAARKLYELRQVKDELATLEEALVRHIAKSLKKGTTTFEDLPALDVRWRRQGVQWDGQSLLPVLVARALDERRMDPETGEVQEREAEAIARVLKECTGLTNPSFQWRVGGLQKRGIDPGEYRSTGGWVPVVRFVT